MDNFRLVSIIPNQYSPNYSYVFKFEKDFNHASKTQWMQKHWSDSFYWALLYLTFIFYGRIYMIQRSTPYQLKLPLIIWNLLLASFSIIGTLRTWPEMIHVLKNYGFTHSVCSNSYHKFVFKIINVNYLCLNLICLTGWRFWLLDLVICFIQTTGTCRYSICNSSPTEIDIFTLVSSFDCFNI